MSKRTLFKFKQQIGRLLIAGFLLAAMIYLLMGRSNKVYAPEEESVSCGISPNAQSGCITP